MKNLPKLDLNVTNRCNFRCVHCAFDSGIEHMSELSLGQLERLLKDTKELGGEKIDITGGEPTIREDIADIVRIAKSIGYKIELVTNGSLLDKEKLLQLKDAGIDSTAISLDGSDYETYSRIRKVDSEVYRRVLQTIEDSVALGIPTKVNTVAFTSNMHDLPAIIRFCIEAGAVENGIYYYTPIGRGKRGDEFSIEPIRWLLFVRENLAPYASQIKLSIEVPLIEKDFKRDTDCILRNDPYHLQILPSGDVYPCAILASHHRPIANLHNTSVKDIWCNKAMWDDYGTKVAGLFSNRFCVGDYEFDEHKYKLVCPLRKFRAEEI